MAHLDLDTLAWEAAVTPPVRRKLAHSAEQIDAFISAHRDWVIEGCYSDLLALAVPYGDELVFLNPGVDACIDNARARPWEPHKYESPEAQHANLAMLIGWISDYETRSDVFSLGAHLALYEAFGGCKHALLSRSAIAAFQPSRP